MPTIRRFAVPLLLATAGAGGAVASRRPPQPRGLGDIGQRWTIDPCPDRQRRRTDQTTLRPGMAIVA